MKRTSSRKSSRNTIGTLIVALIIIGFILFGEEEAPVTSPQPPAAAQPAGEVLPCAAYKEHRKEVNVTLEIPKLGKEKATRVKVLEVTDGDTIAVEKGGERVRVRMMGMDTPERTTTRNGQIEHYGEEAARFAERLIEESGWEVSLTYDQVTTDKYGRDLAYVWLKDGRLMNAVMVAEGYAYSYTSSPKPKYVDLFLGLMREAREQERGLWRVCE